MGFIFYLGRSKRFLNNIIWRLWFVLINNGFIFRLLFLIKLYEESLIVLYFLVVEDMIVFKGSLKDF